jgi:hypothetical protein
MYRRSPFFAAGREVMPEPGIHTHLITDLLHQFEDGGST